MSKRVFRLVSEIARAGAINAVREAPADWTVTIAAPKRTLDQNALWWPQLTDISRQAVHPFTFGRLTPEVWRLMMLDSFGLETPPAIPSLDGSHDVPLELSSSKLDKRTFSDLIEHTYAVGSKLGVLFHDGSKGTEGAARDGRPDRAVAA